MGGHLLIDVLRGMRNQEVLLPGLDKIKTYGAGADLSAKEWSHYILQMIQIGLMEIAYEDGNTLRSTSFGDLVLKGTVPLSLVIPTIDETKIRISKDKTHRKKVEVEDEDNSLFEVLRKIRKQIASEKGVPPYVIFHDKTLRLMEEARPLTLEEMNDISGVSQAKINSFGKKFLNAIIDYKHQN